MFRRLWSANSAIRVSLLWPQLMSVCPAKPDAKIWNYAFENDFVVVTGNARDFIRLLNVEVHPGLIVLREGGPDSRRTMGPHPTGNRARLGIQR